MQARQQCVDAHTRFEAWGFARSDKNLYLNLGPSLADSLLGQSPAGSLELRPSSSNPELRPSMLRPSNSNPELPPMLRQSCGSPSSKYTQERGSVLGRPQLSPSSSTSPIRSSLATVRSSLAERGRHGSFSQLSTGQIVFERTGPFQAATLYCLRADALTHLLAHVSIPTPTCSFSTHSIPPLAYSTTLRYYSPLTFVHIYSDLLAQSVLQDAMLRLIVQQLVHHIPGHAHGKEVYLPGEVLDLY